MFTLPRTRGLSVRLWSLALLVAISLVSCGPTPVPAVAPTVEPTPMPTSTELPTPIPAPTPTLSPPEAPKTDPIDEITVKAGQKLAITASAAGATRYKWRSVGDGVIPEPTHPSVIYTAPLFETIDIVYVTAANDQGVSAEASLIINVLPVTAVQLDALAIPGGWMSCTHEWHPLDSTSAIAQESRPRDCHTGSDCLGFRYRTGAECGTTVWWPACFGKIVNVQCQPADPWTNVHEGQVCTVTVKQPTSEDVQRGTCNINALEAGNFKAIERLSFWARGEQGGEIVTFGVGSPDLPPMPSRSTGRLTLTEDWERHEIDLSGVDLTSAVILFNWHASDVDNPQGAVFYLDDIQFEGARAQATSLAPSEAQLGAAQPAQDAMRHLTELLAHLCWVAYSPTHFDPTASPVRWPSEEDVRKDLRVLRSAGFGGLVTYASNYQDQSTPGQMLDIPKLAQETGFEGMIVGVWNPTDENELAAAEQASRYPVVAGYSVGNEGFDVRYNLKTLTNTMDRLRRKTGKPVTTTEQAADYYENSPLWNISDWIFPNAHPYFAGLRDPQEAVTWTNGVFDALASVSDKPLVFKEVGLPSGGDLNLDETRQAQYYELLGETDVKYVVFEAFDAPWKHLGDPNPDGTYSQPDPEPHWGIFTSSRTPKNVATGICSE